MLLVRWALSSSGTVLPAHATIDEITRRGRLLTYGLQRHRMLLLVAGMLWLSGAIVRHVMFRGFDVQKNPGWFGLQLPNTAFIVGFTASALSCLFMSAGLVLLATRSGATRIVLVLGALLYVAAQSLLVTNNGMFRLGSWREVTLAIHTIVYLSYWPLLLISVLLLAGIGSTTRPAAEPTDEHLFRERAAGAFSGFVFIVTLPWLGILVGAFGEISLSQFWTTSVTDGSWYVLVLVGLSVLAVPVGLGCWGLLVAKRRLGGLFASLFSVIATVLVLAIAVWVVVATDAADNAGDFLLRTWPPFSRTLAIADFVDDLGVWWSGGSACSGAGGTSRLRPSSRRGRHLR